MVEQKVETALLAPTLMLFLTELPASRTADFSALRHITYGTAPISPDLLRRSIETFKCRFSQLYGLTETTGPITALPHEHHVGEKLLSCGRPMFGGRARIVDSDGNDLPPREVGELLYQGENLMAGYWRREKETAQAIRDGWLYTGDAAYMDEDGFIFLKDRTPRHDRVRRRERLSGRGRGRIDGPSRNSRMRRDRRARSEVGRDGQSGRRAARGPIASEASLIEWSRDKLAGFKRPRSVDFIDALPRNASGKLLKRTLREPYWAGYERRVN